MDFPKDFASSISYLSAEQQQALLDTLNQPSPISIRTNIRKLHDLANSKNNRVAWCNTAFYLNEKTSFTLDPLLHAGAYYVQEASSMLIAQAFEQLCPHNEPITVLDLCAAPGGKSTLISSLLADNDVLIANEVINSRASILKENICKWGLGNTIVTNNDPKDFGKLTASFDAIFIDAPCSGEGMFRKDADARNEWSIDNVALCAERQQRIIADVWDALKPGGMLIYSTCTFNQRENEDIADWICSDFGAECCSLDLPEHWGVFQGNGSTAHVYHCFPNRVKGEGFCIAAFRKSDDDFAPSRKPKKADNSKPKKFTNIDKWVTFAPAAYIEIDDEVWAIPPAMKSAYQTFSQLNIVAAGVPLANTKGNKLVPHPALPLSVFFDQSAFANIEIDRTAALQYFRKEALQINCDTRGWVVLTYRNLPIGVVNNLGNRANNPYPAAWRIRMDLPDVLPPTACD